MQNFTHQLHELVLLTKQWIAQEYPSIQEGNKQDSSVLPAYDKVKKDLPLPKLSPIQPKPVKTVSKEPPVAETILTSNPGEKNSSASQALQIAPFALNPIDALSSESGKETFEFLKKIIPQVSLLSTPPDDSHARRIRSTWEQAEVIPEVVILSFQEPPIQFKLLTNICTAIQSCLFSAKVLPAFRFEQKKSWLQLLTTPHLKLVIASDYAIYALAELMRHYKENPKEGKHFLGQVPLLLLADLSLYLREPHLKASLWKALSLALHSK